MATAQTPEATPGRLACLFVCRTGWQCIARRLGGCCLSLVTQSSVEVLCCPSGCPPAWPRSWAEPWLNYSCCHSTVSCSCAALQVNYSKPQVIGIALAGLALLPTFLIPTTPLVWLLAAVLGFWPALATVTIGTFLGEALQLH